MSDESDRLTRVETVLGVNNNNGLRGEVHQIWEKLDHGEERMRKMEVRLVVVMVVILGASTVFDQFL